MRNRKKICLCFLIFAGVSLLLLLCISPGTRVFSDFFVDSLQWDALISSREETSAHLLTQLKFNEYDLQFDAWEDRWYYSLIEQDSMAYDPPVRYAAANREVHIAIQDTPISKEGIAANRDIQILAYTSDAYHIYHLSCTTLPLIRISFDPDRMADAEDRIPVDMAFYLFDNRSNVSRRVTSCAGTFRVRGGMSTQYPKKGYRLSLLQESSGNHQRKNHISLLGMRQDEDWILSAVYSDQEKVRNVFSTNLWMDTCSRDNPFGIACGAEYRFAEVFLNDRYWGLYAIGSPVDAKQTALQKDAVGEYREYLIKGAGWTDLESILSPPDSDDPIAGFEVKSDLEEEGPAWRALRAHYQTLADAQDPSSIYASIDLQNAIDAYLFFGLVQGVDNVRPTQLHNLYFVMKYQNGDPIFLYIPWDLDQTWGNIWNDAHENDIMPYYFAVDRFCPMGLNAVAFLQELGDPDINGHIQARYRQLRQSDWSEENLLAMLDGYESNIYDSGAYMREMSRWPNGTYQDPALGLSVLKDYVLQRLQYTDSYIDALR